MENCNCKKEFMAGEIFQKIPAIMEEMSPIAKDQKNTQQGFKFRGIDDVYNQLQKILAKHKVFSVPYIVSRSSEPISSQKGAKGYRILNSYRFRFYASDGSYIDAFTDGESIDYGDKGSNKAASIAHKYAYLQVFSIPTEEEKDPDKQSHELANPNIKKQLDAKTITGSQLKRLGAMLTEYNFPREVMKELVKERFNLESSKDLNQTQYNEICKIIEESNYGD